MEIPGSGNTHAAAEFPVVVLRRAESLLSLGKTRTCGSSGRESLELHLWGMLGILSASGRQKKLLLRDGQWHQLQTTSSIMSVRKGVSRWSPELANKREPVYRGHHWGRAFQRDWTSGRQRGLPQGERRGMWQQALVGSQTCLDGTGEQGLMAHR